MTTRKHPPVTDSAWFWALLFSVFGLILLFVFSPKYHDLQSMRERRYQARDRIAAEQSGGNNLPQGDRINEGEERRDFASAEQTLIPLWPLAVVLSGVVIVAAIMLYRGRHRAASLADESPPA